MPEQLFLTQSKADHEKNRLDNVQDLILSGAKFEPDKVGILFGSNVNVEGDR